MTSHTNPRSRAALHGQLDDLLSPTPAAAPEPPAVNEGTTSVIDDLTAQARRLQTRPQPPRTAPRAVSATSLTEAMPNRTNETIPNGTIFHNVPLYEGTDEPMEALPWGHRLTESDPRGLKERMDMLEIAIAARDAHDAPPHVEADPHAYAPAVQLAEAHQRLDEMLG